MNIEEQILSEYENSLVVPHQPPRKQFLLCAVGIVGAGKTTVIKPLSEKLSLVRISGDEIRKLLKDRGLGYESLVPIALKLVNTYLSKGYSIALDSDSAGERGRELIRQAQSTFNVLPVWIHIHPPEEFILTKLRNYNHTWLFKDADEAIKNYEERKPLHESVSEFPFVYTFDTSRIDLEEQIEDAARIIEKIVAQ